MAIIKKGDNIIDVVYKGACEESEPTQYGAYNIDVVITPEGTQELHITDADEKPTDMLQARVDATNSCAYLFYKLDLGDVDFARNLDTSKATSMKYMFSYFGKYGMKTLDLSFINSSSNTDTSYMFHYCGLLTGINFTGFDTSKVTNMEYMFHECRKLSELDLSNFDTSNVKYMGNMFGRCEKLTEFDLSNFKTSNVITFNYMFYVANGLTQLNISGWDTSKGTNFAHMFSGCNKLTNIIGELNLVSATSNINNMFDNCKVLETVNLKNIKNSLALGSGTTWGTLLTLDTLINTIKELWDSPSTTYTYVLTLSTPSKELIANTYVKLITPTEEQIAADPNIIYKMPCEVCQSTDEGAMLITDYATLKKWTIK